MLNRGGAETLRENLKLYKRPLGLLMNFNVPALKDGIKTFSESISRTLRVSAVNIDLDAGPGLASDMLEALQTPIGIINEF